MKQMLKVFTLNIWGIPFISKCREERVAALADALEKKDYDIVCLQEVWTLSDFEFIGNKLRVKMPHSFYFFSGLVGSGLCIFSKWPIVGTFYYKFPLNGYFHKFHHGDWLAGKGVAFSKVRMGDSVINVFNTHLHAQYCEENDEYLAHRLSQAYEIAQLIRLSSESGSLTLLIGDFNSKPDDICMQLIRALSGLRDSFLHHEREYEYGTNECLRNSFAPPKTLQLCPEGGRLDYILYTTDNSHSAVPVVYDFALPHRMPGTNTSYSDHEAVEVTLVLEESSSVRKVDHPGIRDLVDSCLEVCKDGECEVRRNLNLWMTAAIACFAAILLSVISYFMDFYPPYFLGFSILSLLFLPVTILFCFLCGIELRSLRGIRESLITLDSR